MKLNLVNDAMIGDHTNNKDLGFQNRDIFVVEKEMPTNYGKS